MAKRLRLVGNLVACPRDKSPLPRACGESAIAWPVPETRHRGHEPRGIRRSRGDRTEKSGHNWHPRAHLHHGTV